MNRLHEAEDEQALETDREISLGIPAILGIFFALALLCACFFGFGYTMGRKSAQCRTRCARQPLADLATAPPNPPPAAPPPAPGCRAGCNIRLRPRLDPPPSAVSFPAPRGRSAAPKTPQHQPMA